MVSRPRQSGQGEKPGCRHGHRRFGLGRRVWDLFGALAMTTGARELQAITTPENTGSIAFHTGLGMSGREVVDYAGPGQARVLFRLER
jgi:hypothetical protein